MNLNIRNYVLRNLPDRSILMIKNIDDVRQIQFATIDDLFEYFFDYVDNQMEEVLACISYDGYYLLVHYRIGRIYLSHIESNISRSNASTLRIFYDLPEFWKRLIYPLLDIASPSFL